MTDFSGFPDRLRSALKERNLTQVEFARQLNISKHTLTKYLNGRIPETEIMYHLAHLLNKPMEWFLTGQTSIEYLSYGTKEPPEMQRIAPKWKEECDDCYIISRQDRLQYEWIKIFNQFSPDGKALLLSVLRMIVRNIPPDEA